VEEYEVNMNITVDPDANFFESDREENVRALLDLLKSVLYEVDDLKVTYIEVEKR
jgi:hypothetical protein